MLLDQIENWRGIKWITTCHKISVCAAHCHGFCLAKKKKNLYNFSLFTVPMERVQLSYKFQLFQFTPTIFIFWLWLDFIMTVCPYDHAFGSTWGAVQQLIKLSTYFSYVNVISNWYLFILVTCVLLKTENIFKRTLIFRIVFICTRAFLIIQSGQAGSLVHLANLLS